MSFGIIPYNIEFKRWASQLNNVIPNLTFPIPVPTKDWRQWALALLILNPKTLATIPTPSIFIFPKEEDWRRWASFFTQVIQAL